MGSTMPMPQAQPRLKMQLPQSQLHMLPRPRSLIPRRPSGRPGPKVLYFSQMSRPILDMGRKNRPDLPMLPHICIKVLQQELQTLPAAHTLKE